MKEIIAIIRPEKWQATRESVETLDVQETVHVRVLGRGRERGLHYLRRMTTEQVEATESDDVGVQFLPKRMVSWLVPDETVNGLVAAVIRVNKADNFGDGKIFVCPVDSVSDAENPEAGATP